VQRVPISVADDPCAIVIEVDAFVEHSANG
jgi:hypothetical protein